MSRQSLKNVMRLIQEAEVELPPEQSFLADLKRSIELDADRGARKPSQTFKPSSMNCIRASYYQIRGIDPEPASSNYNMVGIANSGTDAHVRFQTAIAGMKNNGIDCEYVNVADYVKSRELEDLDIVSQNGMETKLYNKRYNISFLCDGIIRYKGKYYILELKTETSYKWQNRKGVDPGHYNQATTYSLSLKLEDVLFIYINRDISDMKAYLFHVDDEMRMGVVNYIQNCNYYLTLQQTPPKPEDIAKKTCSYCRYRETCRKDT